MPRSRPTGKSLVSKARKPRKVQSTKATVQRVQSSKGERGQTSPVRKVVKGEKEFHVVEFDPENRHYWIKCYFKLKLDCRHVEYRYISGRYKMPRQAVCRVCADRPLTEKEIALK